MKKFFWFGFAFLAITLSPKATLVAQQPAPAPADQQCGVPVYKGSEVDKKLRILAKPEPDFNAADRRGHPDEKILLTATFCGTGQVTEIGVQTGISDRLNEKALSLIHI